MISVLLFTSTKLFIDCGMEVNLNEFGSDISDEFVSDVPDIFKDDSESLSVYR